MRLATLSGLLPTEIDRDYLPPTMRGDGSIQYIPRDGQSKPPITPDGFEPDETNPWLFCPLWRECGLRFWRVKARNDGSISISAICRESSCPHFNQIVRHNTCLHCNIEPAVAEIPPAVELPKIRRKKCGSCSSSVS